MPCRPPTLFRYWIISKGAANVSLVITSLTVDGYPCLNVTSISPGSGGEFNGSIFCHFIQSFWS